MHLKITGKYQLPQFCLLFSPLPTRREGQGEGLKGHYLGATCADGTLAGLPLMTWERGQKGWRSGSFAGSCVPKQSFGTRLGGFNTLPEITPKNIRDRFATEPRNWREKHRTSENIFNNHNYIRYTKKIFRIARNSIP